MAWSKGIGPRPTCLGSEPEICLNEVSVEKSRRGGSWIIDIIRHSELVGDGVKK